MAKGVEDCQVVGHPPAQKTALVQQDGHGGPTWPSLGIWSRGAVHPGGGQSCPRSAADTVRWTLAGWLDHGVATRHSAFAWRGGAPVYFKVRRHQPRGASWRGSSVVEQGTHKPLVGSSNLPPAT